MELSHKIMQISRYIKRQIEVETNFFSNDVSQFDVLYQMGFVLIWHAFAAEVRN